MPAISDRILLAGKNDSLPLDFYISFPLERVNAWQDSNIVLYM